MPDPAAVSGAAHSDHRRLLSLLFVSIVLAGGCRPRRGASTMDSALPGASPIDEPLAARLRAALEAKGPDYQPRTHHLVGRAPRYTNRLILQSSPYLLQHAHNPVSWYPWGDEAFAEARRTGKPVFLSIGYSTCHWCHVMEGESFEDETIARFMNEHYVCIKVDREERPDLDAIYMAAVQALTGSGGWPMSVWLTPEREPFFGGTYFPPRDGARGATHGFLSILNELVITYHKDPERVKQAAASLSRAVREQMDAQATPAGGAPGAPSAAPIVAAVDHFKKAFDETDGGVRRAPKFPSNIPVRLLLRYHRRSGDAAALRMATLTLEKMAAGGMYDQIGGGFHRYSTDAHWLVPHFEKMLYDNALLAVAYAEAHQVTGRPDFARVVRETLDYVLREMTAPQGAFYSATDADSEGEEGKFFVWTEGELRERLGAEAARFMRHYGVSAGGNFHELPGANILHVAHPDETEWAALAAARATLYEARSRRAPPLRDDKLLASWNGLMISGLAVGGRVLDQPRYLVAASRAAEFVLGPMRFGGDGGLMRSFRDPSKGEAPQPGFLDDYAFVAAGLFDLYEATFDARWLREALALCDAVERRFADKARGGWFMTGDDHEKLIAREKPSYDGAEPSGSSVALRNALRAYAFTGDDRWRAVAERGFASLRNGLANQPVAVTEALLALDQYTDLAREVAVIWPPGAAPSAAEPLLAVLRRTFLPNAALAGAADGEGVAELAKLAPFVAEKVAQRGQPTVYVCEHGRCELPATEAAPFEAQLDKPPRPY
jgi:uncharacterized protein YyaL (SSP411 family)